MAMIEIEIGDMEIWPLDGDGAPLGGPIFSPADPGNPTTVSVDVDPGELNVECPPVQDSM